MSEEQTLVHLQNWYGITETQAELAVAYVETGVLRKAAKRANINYRTAKRLLVEHAGFRMAVNELLHTLLTDDKVKARAVLRSLLDDENAAAATRIKSAQELWNRADGMPLQRTEKKDASLEELATEIKQLSKQLGIKQPQVIDVKPEEPNGQPSSETAPSDPPGEVRREGEV